MERSCSEVRAALEAAVDGDLPEPRLTPLRAHLAGCAECRRHHAEAVSLPSRLAALRSPEPPPTLVSGVLRQVGAARTRPLEVWGLLAAEALLVLVAGWYVSGLGGLLRLGSRTAADVGAWLEWLGGQALLPAPPTGDVFLLLLAGLLALVSLLHLALLSRHGLPSAG